MRSVRSPEGEKLWRLPMEDTYREILESPIADMKNTGIQNRFGGAITASLFLREFVDTSKVSVARMSTLVTRTLVSTTCEEFTGYRDVQTGNKMGAFP